ncbi:MAG: hypothetical protein EBW87_00130 [Burkholderiaceae bacterium]|nr:hypothetical protein [Burkholderiaceae bacterium]
MTTKKLFAVIAFALTSCVEQENLNYSYIDPKLEKYFQLFINEAKQRNIPIYINNPKLKLGTISGASGITIRKKEMIIIDSLSDAWTTQPEQLLFHELGHLYLHRDHDNSINEKGQPKSIMNQYRLPLYDYLGGDFMPILGERKKFIDELFSTI